MENERFSRTAGLIGADGLERLSRSSVMLFGLGGVGGFALEALARAGIGELWLVDHDRISESNRNRQILALGSTVGMAKTEVGARRVLDINPDAIVHAEPVFVDAENLPLLLERAKPSFLIDAIDTVTSKLAIIGEAKRRELPVISCMGTGNHLDPERFVIGDISKSTVCPLARVMRTELRKRGITGVPALWSTEPPVISATFAGEAGRHPPSSISCVPSVAGLLLASYVIRQLLTTV